MKKQLSLILTIILILSLTPIALADNTDTISNWNIRISVPEGKTAVLKGSEYYIYGQHEGSIPYVMLSIISTGSMKDRFPMSCLEPTDMTARKSS